MAAFGTTPAVFGGFAIDRQIFRTLVPDTRWYCYAAGLVDPGDGNNALLELVYEKDDLTFIPIGSLTVSGAGERKVSMGPFDLYATPGVPRSEAIAVVRLRATKSAGVDGTAVVWNIQIRLLPQVRPGR